MSKLTEEHIEHLKTFDGEKCLVCENTLIGTWTDYNGQIRCSICGTTYQILGSHIREEVLKENGLKKEDISEKYCDVFTLVPLLRDYWQETKRQVPFGTYFMTSPIPESDYDSFYNWLGENADKYRETYEDEFNWDRILAPPPLKGKETDNE